MRLILGLGNPGRTYKYSRHNIGFLLIDMLTKKWGIKLKRDLSTKSYSGKGRIENKEVILARPISFMNLSGNSVNLLLNKYYLAPEDMLLAFDDLDLELGRIRIKSKGSSGGHKGAESIIRALGSCNFARLRIGIGRPRQKKEVINHVLSSFSRRERDRLSEYLERAADCCKTWVVLGIELAMNKFNPQTN